MTSNKDNRKALRLSKSVQKKAATAALVAVLTTSLLPLGSGEVYATKGIAVHETQASKGQQQEQGTTHSELRLVPLRAVSEAIGIAVNWDGVLRQVGLSRGEVRADIRIGDDWATVQGARQPIGAVAVMQDGRTLVPLAFIRETFAVDIDWDGVAERVVVADDQLALKASLFVDSLNRLDLQAVSGQLSSALNERLPAEMQANFVQQLQSSIGRLIQQQFADTHDNGVHREAVLIYTAERVPQPIRVVVRYDSNGLVDEYKILANSPEIYMTAAYDQPALYAEREVVIGEGTFALPGTLTLPAGKGPFPVAILVHGSGPQDRDSSIGGSKPFKDIASGLAAQGVASLRYDKLTYVHTLKVSGNPHLTLYEESAADVKHAVSLLSQFPEIDSEQLFVVGHSQGGYVVPMLVREIGDQLAGAALLAAPSDNIGRVVVEQQHEALDRLQQLKMPEGLIAQQEMAVATYDQAMKVLYNSDYSLTKLPEMFVLPSPYWWFEQRDYEPAKLAAEQKLPLLIMQGENDWQVTMNQFAGWQKQLAGRTNVEWKTYPHMNHLLSRFDQLSVGQEYGQPANVDEQLIVDLAKWILR